MSTTLLWHQKKVVRSGPKKTTAAMNGRPEFHKRPKLGRERNGSFLTFLLETGQSGNGPFAVVLVRAQLRSLVQSDKLFKAAAGIGLARAMVKPKSLDSQFSSW